MEASDPAHTAPVDKFAEFEGLVEPQQKEHKKRPNSKKLIAAVAKRDGRWCRFCETSDDLTIDHIRPRAMGGGDELKNLRILCKWCHSKVTREFALSHGHLFDKPHIPCVLCGHGKSSHRTKRRPKQCTYKDARNIEPCPCPHFEPPKELHPPGPKPKKLPTTY